MRNNGSGQSIQLVIGIMICLYRSGRTIGVLMKLKDYEVKFAGIDEEGLEQGGTLRHGDIN